MVFNSVVKGSCSKHLQDIITTYVHDVTTLRSNNQPRSQCTFSLKNEAQKALGTSLSNNGKEQFYRVLLQKVEVEKVEMSTFLFACPLARLFWLPQLLSYELTLPLLYCGIFAWSPALDRLQLKCWSLPSFTVKTSCSKR